MAMDSALSRADDVSRIFNLVASARLVDWLNMPHSGAHTVDTIPPVPSETPLASMYACTRMVKGSRGARGGRPIRNPMLLAVGPNVTQAMNIAAPALPVRLHMPSSAFLDRGCHVGREHPEGNMCLGLLMPALVAAAD